MSWNLPDLPTAGVTIATVANWATKVIDSLRFLKGLDGAVTLSDALILPDGSGKYIHIPSLTTTQRDALTPTAGMLIYNSTTTQFNKYENGAWRSDLGFNSAHSGLSGLTAGDDHTQYQKESLLTTAGDLPFATGASAWDRLAIGTVPGQLLRTNAGKTAPEWASVAVTTNSGSYAGVNGVNTAVAHGLGVIPKIVFIKNHGATVTWYDFQIIVGLANIYCLLYNDTAISSIYHAVTAPDVTNFYVGNATSYSQSANYTSFTYYWVAIG